MPELVVTGTGSIAGDTKAQKARAFIELSLKRWQQSSDAESTVRQKMLEDKRFYAGEQWEPAIKAERRGSKRPCLTVNKLKHPVRLVANQARTTKPRIQLNPVDSGSDPKTAEALQGVTRNIETQSDAGVAYQTALEDAAICGRGWLRVLTAYADTVGAIEDESAFQQEIRIKRVRNCFSVYPDPSVQEADYSDMKCLHVTQDLEVDKFKRQYPKSQLASLSQMTGIGDGTPGWITGTHVRICEYFYIESEVVTICLIEVPSLPDPQTGKPQPATRMVLEKPADGFMPGITVVAEREIERRKLKWCKHNATEILDGNDDQTEGRDLDGQWIPFIPVLGEELDIDGDVDLVGVVRDSQDSARLYNVQVTALAEMIGLQPKAPFIGAEGQFKGHENKWNQANVRNFSYLEYAPVTLNGRDFAPPPQRQQFEAPIQAVVVSIQQADNDIKSQTMFQDASLGERGPQESGKAILARQRQGEMGSSHYMDNLARAIRHTGRILVDLIPRIYSAPRIMRIIGDDDTERTVLIHNQAAPGDLKALQDRHQDIAGIYDIGVGRFDVTVSIGPSSETQRQEGSEMMIAAMQANPQLFPVIGDLAFGMMDFPGARAISERLKKMLPPQLQDQPGGKADPAQLQQQIQQMQQAGQQMQQQMQQMHQALEQEQAKAQATVAAKQAELENKSQLAQLEASTRVQIAQIQANADLVKAEATLNGQRGLAVLEAQLAEISERLRFQRETAVLGTEHARADVKDTMDRTERAAERDAAAPVDAGS